MTPLLQDTLAARGDSSSGPTAAEADRARNVQWMHIPPRAPEGWPPATEMIEVLKQLGTRLGHIENRAEQTNGRLEVLHSIFQQHLGGWQGYTTADQPALGPSVVPRPELTNPSPGRTAEIPMVIPSVTPETRASCAPPTVTSPHFGKVSQVAPPYEVPPAGTSVHPAAGASRPSPYPMRVRPDRPGLLAVLLRGAAARRIRRHRTIRMMRMTTTMMSMKMTSCGQRHVIRIR